MHLQGDEVKMGQVLGYIEQLGTLMPLEVINISYLSPQHSTHHAFNHLSAGCPCFAVQTREQGYLVLWA